MCAHWNCKDITCISRIYITIETFVLRLIDFKISKNRQKYIFILFFLVILWFNLQIHCGIDSVLSECISFIHNIVSAVFLTLSLRTDFSKSIKKKIQRTHYLNFMLENFDRKSKGDEEYQSHIHFYPNNCPIMIGIITVSS